MNVVNGEIRHLLPQDSSTDERGRPKETIAQWSSPLPCCIQTNTDNRRGSYDDGKFRMAAFTVLVDIMPYPHNRVKLTRLGEELGEYKVISATPLTAVCKTKIVVSK